MSEKWLPVSGYEGLYEVSDQGNIRALPKKVIRPHTRPYVTKMHTLKPAPGNKHGHLHLTLVDADGVPQKHWVHRLVALAWCPRENGQDVVRHGINGPTDNRASQLAWGTHADNAADKDVHGTVPVYVPKTHCGNGHKMTPENTYIPPKNPTHRNCKQCQRERTRSYRKENPKKHIAVVVLPRKCLECGDVFTPRRRRDAVFCSAACKSKNHRRHS